MERRCSDEEVLMFRLLPLEVDVLFLRFLLQAPFSDLLRRLSDLLGLLHVISSLSPISIGSRIGMLVQPQAVDEIDTGTQVESTVRPLNASPLIACLAAPASRWANDTSDGPVLDIGYAEYLGPYNATSDINSWFGIYFTQSPVGELRWQAPQDIASKNN